MSYSPPSPRSLAYLRSSRSMAIDVVTKDDGSFEASTTSFPDIKATAEDSSQAIANLQQNLREAAEKGVL